MTDPLVRHARGTVSVHPRGFGFFTEENTEAPASSFVIPPELNAFLADDLVEALITVGEDGRTNASALKLIERPRTELYGTVIVHRGVAHLKVDREVANTDWPLVHAGPAPAAGAHVLARIDGAKAVLVDVPETPDAQTLAQVIARHGIATVVGPAALAEAERARGIAHTVNGRRDLREVPTVTIDAASTRDIDDAISVLPADEDGAVRLMVSIADVSAFVPPGSPLDLDARARATSVYLAGRVIPMLPDGLSSEWISLLPGVDRMCLTAELRIDPEGAVVAVDVYESLIRSWARLTYDEVAEFLDHGDVSPALEAVYEAAPWWRTVSARLHMARTRRGGVEVARDETFVVLDAVTGLATGIEAHQPTSAHVLIERCMVAANEAVARWLAERGVPGVFRVHDVPGPDAVRELSAVAERFGYASGFGHTLSPLALAAFDHQISASPSEPAIRGVLLRSLGPARYTVFPSSHFGLGASLYLHFTSPIRRYADLAVHRLVKSYLHGTRAWSLRDPELESLARHINLRARLAARAETDRHRMLVAGYMTRHVGEHFSARVVKVRPFGVVAQIDTTLVEGTLAFDVLPDGPYTVEPSGGAARSATRRYAVGDAVRVTVVRTDPSLGRIELALAPKP
ncbi:MAG: 3-5 exoribonuclease, VacB/RNase family [Myxococcaceae bacterium]|nr:3-5 exoribonuclease, VacB/RNase family [Myxococcaceae bacterium]